MGMLNISQLLFTNSFWKTLIDFFYSFLGNYGWAIIVFTIILKLVLSPLDFWQRKVTKKNTEMQAIVQPEIDALQKKYPNDKEKVNQATMAIYKKHNYNVIGSCLVMLVYMVVTFAIFITLFNSLRYIAQIELVKQYESLKTVYTQNISDEEIAKTAVLDKFEDIKKETRFLWVKNIWKADTNTSVMMSFDEYYKEAKLNFSSPEEKAEEEELYKTIENIVYSSHENAGWNGYFILIALAGIISFLSQWLTTKLTKPKIPKGGQDPTASTNKIMLIVMPVLMLVFAWSSSSLFAIYLITNSIMSTLITLLISQFSKGKNTATPSIKQSKKQTKVVEYSRNYFKGEK